MFERMKDLVAPIRTEDPLFGELRFQRDARFWEGRVPFGPTAGDVEVLVAGDPSGPTDEQRSMFREIRARYSEIWPVVKARLVAESVRVGAPSGADFILVCVDIPERPGAAPEWALSYTLKPPSWHFTVSMKQRVPHEVLAEC